MSTDQVTATSLPREFLDIFWKLGNEDENIRVSAAKELVFNISNAQDNHKQVNGSTKKETPQLSYSINRLVKGLAGRVEARQGFAVALTEVSNIVLLKSDIFIFMNSCCHGISF